MNEMSVVRNSVRPCTWAIREDLVEQLDERGKSPLGQNRVELDQLVRLLKCANIPHEIVAKEDWTRFAEAAEKIPVAPRIDFDEQAAYKTIWENELTKVEMVTENGRRHLLVSPRKPLPFVEGAIRENPEEYAAVKRTAYWVASSFGKAFDSPDYAQTLELRQGSFSIELVPSGTKPGVVDLRRKDERNVSWLSKGEFGSRALPPASDFILEREIQISCNAKVEEVPPLLSDFSIENWGQAAVYRSHTALSIWSHLGLPVVSLPSDEPISPPDLPPQLKKTGGCAFCKASVIQNESLHVKSLCHNILFNMVPYMGQQAWDVDQGAWIPNLNTRHFMVVSKEHKMYKTDLEIVDEQLMTARLLGCQQQLYPDTTPTIFEQMGLGSGLTVPHHHLQVAAATTADTAGYMYHLAKEGPIVGSNNEWPKPFAQPSPILTANYNALDAVFG